MGEDIKIKYLTDIKPLEINEKGDWIDLRAAQDMYIPEFRYTLIPLGVAIQLPEGYEAIMSPRSSLYKNFGVIQANSIGVIDNSYCGNNDQWYFPAVSFIGSFIHKNDRICQFRIIENQPKINFKVVDQLDNKDRGGIGSTGIK